MSCDLTVEGKIKLLNNELEEAVKDIFPMKTGKLPGNKIPKRARELMSKKSKLGAKISRLRDWRHAEKLINEFETTEMELSEFYI